MVACCDENGVRQDNNASRRSSYRQNLGSYSSVRIFTVEELRDHEPVFPKSIARYGPSGDNAHPTRLSMVTRLPQQVWRSVWPWRLMKEIREILKRTPQLCGVLQQQEQDTLRPMTFAFRLAANLPLQESEKLRVLRMHCTVERLQFLLDKVMDIKQSSTFVCCKSCSVALSPISTVFTVGGADGTTGNYGE